jgi:hypothetical protein
LGDWHANILFLGRSPHVIAVNDKSLITLVLPLKEARTVLDRWRAEVLRLIGRLGAPEEVLQAEADALQDVVVTRTTSRSSIGYVNEMARHCRGLYEDHGELRPEDVDLVMENLPCQVFRYDVPAQVARRLLGAPVRERRSRHGGGVPTEPLTGEE